MKLAIIGASGNVGTRLVTEALNRGHSATAIVRNPAKVPFSKTNLSVVAGDANTGGDLAPKLGTTRSSAPSGSERVTRIC